MLSPGLLYDVPRATAFECYGGSGTSRPSSCRVTPSASAHVWPWRGLLVAAASVGAFRTARSARSGGSRRVWPGAASVHPKLRVDSQVGTRARNDTWFETVKTTELEEALRALGFDGFPKMKNRRQVASWVQKLRIPFEVVEGALKEVRSARKAEARRRQGKETSPRRSKDKREPTPKKNKQKLKFKDAGLNKFSEAQLRTVLNICGVQGTSGWPKEDLVQRLRSLGLRQHDVQNVLREVAPQSRPPRSRSRKKQRPRSRAEREFYGAGDQDFVREFMKEEYDDWDDRYDDVDDYFDFTMDDEPWESVPWDFDDYLDDAHEETQYRSSRRTSGPTQDYYYYDTKQDPWTRSGSTYGAANEAPWSASTWPKQPKLSPEEAMAQALREGWAAESLSHMQALLLLGLSGRPGRDEVSKVRRQMALRWHPDKNPENANAAVAFQLVMAAAVKLA